MPTALWDVRAALATLFTATLDPVPVFDGPLPTPTSEKTFVLVGSDGAPDGTGSEADDGSVIEQRNSDLGPGTWRDEAGGITCAVWAWSGDTDLAPLRSVVSAVLDAVEVALSTDRTLGGLLVADGRIEFSGLRFHEEHTSKGPFVRAVFTIAYQALIT